MTNSGGSTVNRQLLITIALFAMGNLITAAGVYAAIRADLASLIARAEDQEHRITRLENWRDRSPPSLDRNKYAKKPLT